MKIRTWTIRLIFAISFAIFPLAPGGAADSVDYEFYKKNGHNDKNWNEDVKLGFEAYDQQNCDLALSHLRKAVSAQCQDGLVFFKMAVCSELIDSPYTAVQYYQLAQEKLEKTQGTHRYKNEIYENYGRALFKAGKHDLAFPLLVKAVALGTPSFGLNYMVGYLYSKKGDFQGAVDSFNRALTYDTTGVAPDLLGGVYREVAKAQVQQKNYQAAMPLLDKALQLNPQDQEATKLRNEASLGLQQGSMIEMIQNLSGDLNNPTKAKTVVGSQPPPPAAAKLPPLESQGTLKDPTPPLGSPTPPSGNPPATSLQSPPPPAVPQPAISLPTTGGGTTPMKLEPLPPARP